MLLAKRPIGTVAYLGGLMAVPEEFCWSFCQMVQFNNEYLCQPSEFVHLIRAKTSYHVSARNNLVERYMGDWLLMFDTDHAFEPDICVRLVSAMQQFDLDVVTALYHYKVPPYLPVLYHWEEGMNSFTPLAAWPAEADLIEAGCAGAGSLLVRRRVFDRIRTELKENPFDIIPPLSEDFSFFRRLHKLGIKMHCVPAIESYHLTVRQITSADKDLTGLNLQTTKPQEAPGALQ